ncbi:MAG: hypothetical protein GXO58_05920 [Thermodesulfobacteria bacterium]|nr:hypothetical protein [Thermodesulfobacteriota bacterium]
MPEKCIVPQDWKDYFDELYKKLKGKEDKVEIEIEAPSVFEGEEAKGLSLIGLSYDPKDKVFSVMCENLEHMIHKPQEICVEEEDGGVKQIRAVDGTGVEHFIKFAIPLK